MSATPRSALAVVDAAIRAARDVVEQAEADPLAQWRPCPPQEAWLRDAGRVKLLRGANQVGKTAAQCAEALWRCLGCHPYYATRRPPIEAWMICHSWEQSVSVQGKLWAMLPRGTIEADVAYVPGRGFRGTSPCVRFKNGSLLKIKTTSQGSLGVATATLDYVGIDEPPPPEIWGELAARVLRRHGTIGITMTPVGRDVAWLRELVTAGIVSDHAAPLTVENVTPAGGRALLTQAQIDAVLATYLSFERGQRGEGAWEADVEDRILTGWSQDLVSAELPEGDVELGIGIDHGAGAGRQRAALVAVERREDSLPHVWLVDMACSDGRTTPEDDATGICDMLVRNGIVDAKGVARLSDVDWWVGDRAHGGDRFGAQKSNRLIKESLSYVLHVPMYSLPLALQRMSTPRKRMGSVSFGCRLLNGFMVSRRFHVHPRCETFIAAASAWRGRSEDPHKDSIDAVRYIVERLVDAGQIAVPASSPIY